MKIDPIKQFALKVIMPIKLFGLDLSVTNSAIFMLVSAVLIILFFQVALHNPNHKIPRKMQSILESLFHFVSDLTKENIGKNYKIYLPLIFSLFTFLLMGNLIGLIPFSFTFTSHLIITFSLALMVFLFTIFISLKKFGWSFFGRFVPSGTPGFLIPIIIPIEVLSFMFRPISLSMRLFANMLAGHIILKVFSSFVMPIFMAINNYFEAILPLNFIMGLLLLVLPISLNIMFIVLECLVAVIQAYIFACLTCIYIRDALESH